MRQSLITVLVTLISIIPQLESHYIPKIKDNRVHISGYVNQAKQINIPFKKCFQVDTELAANLKYINFEPSSLKLTEVKHGTISENHQVSVLQNLRSPQSYSHEHLIVFDSYALVFMPPNQVVVIKQDQNGNYKVEKRKTIRQLNQYSQFKMYKFNNQAIMLLYSSGLDNQKLSKENQKHLIRAFLISQKDYKQIKMPTTNSIAHFEANGRQFFTAEYGQGVGGYSYTQHNQSVAKVASYSRKAFSHLTESPYIVDINIDSLKSDNIIYALDGIKGVFRINLTSSQREPKIDLVVSEPNCNAMDSMSADHLVLVCQLGSASYIVQAYANKTQTGEIVFNKLQPQYHVNYFNDLEINKNYFLVFSHRTLNVYWSSKENNIPQTVNTRSQLDLPGLETFYFRMNSGPNNQSYLYLIQSGTMKQMLISESSAKLTVKSLQPIQKNFNISIFGNCQDLSQSLLNQITKQYGTQLVKVNLQNLESSTCELQKSIFLEIVEENSPRKEDFSVSASIIVILIVIFLLVIWICLKKYKGLQREARKVLEAYKKKKARI